MTTETLAQSKEESHVPEGVERAKPDKVFRPQLDIIESPEAVVLIADLPGVDETEVEVSLDKNVLTIHGNVKPGGRDGFKPTYSEYEVGDYERSFTVSSEIDREGIEAIVKDGVLRLTLPKSKKTAMKKVQVRSG